MGNTLMEAGIFGVTGGFAWSVGQQVWSNPLYRNYIMLATVGIILLWIVLLNGHRRLL